MNDVRIELADLGDQHQAAAFLEVLDAYARDPMGGGAPLTDDVRERLVPSLLAHPTSRIWLAWEAERAIGVLVGFLGFSTFRARPLLNVHDLAVVPERRGQRLGEQLLTAAETHARSLGCCKLTLEVQEHNKRARALYKRVGFGHFSPGVEQNPTTFLEKPLA
ncbi:MAG: GNAT family N-acetyltransferase [Deltaproteobacteria bacterium]|nr:GNAT family N-acetyltransferase [Deltaproteobacteria bacterium]MBW2396944.1 GNAT family N-acetyltransferase [Deltaproteobacteria bacterium]